MPTISIDDLDLYYDEGGVGAPVVYVHGGFPSLASYLLNLPRDGTDWTWENDFARNFRFVEYDRRGCYRSSCPEDGYGLLDGARDLESLFDHLRIASAHLIGSSAGGPIATVFAATRPDRTMSLTLVGTAITLFPPGDPVSQIIRRQIDVLQRQGVEAAFEMRPEGVEVSLSVLWEPPEYAERGELDEYWAKQRDLNEQARRTPRTQRLLYYGAELRSIRGYMDADVSGYAREIGAPTLVLHGANDRMVPLTMGRELFRAVPGARLDVMQGLPHSLVIRHSEARQRVISFMREIESPHS